MKHLWLWAVVGAAASAQEPLLPSATLEIQRAFERVGRGVPARDAVLQKAAEALARSGLDHGAARAAEAATVAHAVSDAGGHDPSPRALVIRASPPERALESLRERTELNEESATHFGVAVVQRGEEAVLVVLLAERKLEMEPFPHRLNPGSDAHSLCGILRSPLERAEVYVTRPSGTVEKLPVTREAGSHFCTTVKLLLPGEHSLEVIGHGPSGPEVAALFFVDVGATVAAPGSLPFREPSTVAEGRQAVLQRINSLRAANAALPLALDDTLNAVAQAYSDRMAREHFFAHVAPDGATLNLRLRRTNFAYRRAGENLGIASGPISAHLGIEQSPGHRQNLLEPEFELLGLGISTEQLPGRTQVILTEVLATPVKGAEGAVIAVHQAVARRRAELKLPALERTAVLDSLALERVREALARGNPEDEALQPPLQQRVFAALTDAQYTSMDLFVADQASFIPDSESLRRPGNTRVGVGAVRGRSAADDRDRYWVVVIYAGDT